MTIMNFTLKPEQLDPPKENKPAPAPAPVEEIDPGTGWIKRPEALPDSMHFKTRDKGLLLQEYRYLFSIASITPKWMNEVERCGEWAIANKATFSRVTALTSVPWYVVAIINIMEMGTRLTGTLLNGDPWDKKTVHFPSGHGPWRSWESAAVYAIRHEAEGWHLDTARINWSDIGEVFWYLEAWNGFNARMTGQYEKTTPQGASPYIYSGTPFYVRGKKLENPTRFDPDLESQQIGCMAFLLYLRGRGQLK